VPQRWTVGDFVWVIVIGIMASLAATFIALAVTGVETPTAAQVFTLLLPAQLAGSLLALSWVRSKRAYASFREAYGLGVRGQDLRFLGLGALLNVGLSLLFLPVVRAIGVEDSPQQVVQIVEDLQGTGLILVAALVTAVVAPIVEELTYRGLLLRLVAQRSNAVVAVVVSSIIFASIHLLTLENFDRDTLQVALAVAVPELFILGMVMARMTVRSQILGPAIMTHAGYNLLSFVALVAAPTLIESL